MKYTSQEPITEKGMVDAVETLLRKLGYRILPQLRIRTWRPDVVGLKGDEIVIVEAKGRGSDLRRGLAQTALYSTDATSAYLALPTERIHHDIKEAAKALGIGLISVGETASIELKATPSEPRAALLRRIRRMRNISVQPVGKAKRRASPATARLLRHRRVLEVLLARPARRFTIRELSQEAGISYSTTWRMVQDLEALGAVIGERVGTSRLLSLNQQAPVVKELRSLADLELSPHRLAAREFSNLLERVPEVRRAILFGSVSRGREAATSDVDVAVVLTKKNQSTVNRIYDFAQSVQDRIRMKIAPLFVTESDLDSPTPLMRSIKSGEVLFERP